MIEKLKLLIVEDERWEREGLIHFIDWARLGIEVAGTAVDGIDGLEQAERLRPDIVITDIRMPGMDGIQMAKALREAMPEVHIVLLTGYDDFSYAMEAIKFKAEEYVLKPVEEGQMLEVMDRVAGQCRRAKLRSEDMVRLKEQVERQSLAERSKRLSDLLEGKPDENGGSLSVLPAAGSRDGSDYAVWSLKWTAGAAVQAEALEGLLPPETAAEVTFIEGLEADWLALVSAPRGTLADGTRAEALARELMRRLRGVPPVIGIGGCITQPAALPEGCRQAREARRFAEFWSREGAVSYRDIAQLHDAFTSDAFTVLNRANALTRSIVQSVSALDYPRAAQALEELFAWFEVNKGAGQAFVHSHLVNLVCELSILVNGKDLYADVDMESDLRSMHRFTAQYLERAFDIFRQKRNDTEEYVITKVLQIIEQRYPSPDINLKTIAAEVFLSPNYLGAQFKKTTGKSFGDYLTEYRMEKAKERLRHPGAKVARVAEEVGIPNTSYFCVVFKNTAGMSPGEYQSIALRG